MRDMYIYTADVSITSRGQPASQQHYIVYTAHGIYVPQLLIKTYRDCYVHLLLLDRQIAQMDGWIDILFIQGRNKFREPRYIAGQHIAYVQLSKQILLTGVWLIVTHTHTLHTRTCNIYISLNVNQIESMYINVDKRNLCIVYSASDPTCLCIINSFTTFSLLRLFFLFFLQGLEEFKIFGAKNS